jgi:hypothetical protein
MFSKIALGLPVLFLLHGCITTSQSYYLSPQNASSNPYHTIPLKSDSVKGAVYGSLVYTTGSANYSGHDYLSVFQASVYRSNNFGRFQAYYGGNLSLSAYHVAEYYNSHYRYNGGIAGIDPIPIDTIYHIPGGKESFGGYGLSGGINYVIPFSKGEWRALGLETSIQNEFGNYAEFREGLPDTAASLVFRKRLTTTLGLYTDILWKGHHGKEYGFKFALGMTLNPQDNYTITKTDITVKPANIFPLTYFSTSYHMTIEPFSGFLQFNFGTYADNFQIGMSYRLGKK